ncbi:hypothetical protein SAY87_004228 [Trapa incisa]|uniref:Uncharacterized protein n=2 Tax=Trapa TaxID=22665 RepID=A0AAN7LKD3_TRANT|nr:hypothetical protein SAY87_004228 [Trapa incisa]KAK4782451.1 hypothetical protein SAY86_016553 [Trapa natans]
MAEEAAPEVVENRTDSAEEASCEDMEVVAEADSPEDGLAVSGSDGVGNGKRSREEEEEEGEPKKQRVEKSVEEERVEKTVEEGRVEEPDRIRVGAKEFGTSVEMYNYYYNFLRFWPPNINANKYEHMMLLELIKNGHSEPEKKIDSGVKAFQVRYHPVFKSRCFFLVKEDGSMDDFSFRKCVDHIAPLPDDMKPKTGGLKGRGGRGRGHGHGQGGKGRF